jgi:PAS domain S-box-containing protein
MIPSSWFGAGEESRLQVLWEDGERVYCRGWRDGSDGDRKAVLAVLPAEEHPTAGNLHRLSHEYGLKDDLDGAWAVRPLELVRERGRTMLVLADPGGEPLDRLIGHPMELERFLRLAAALSAALGRVHERGLIHKDIKPAHVLVDSATGQVWLMGFGIASRLPRERQSPEPPEVIAGTLAYMAPEQTGRMNRSIDSRSDLYALGVTLYEMLTGVLPFTASDPMEWVHCHVARQPVPPTERLADVPASISAIILKLLAKTSEERYQTAAGVESDIRRCLAEWHAHGRIDDFPLGQHDTPDRILIPEKLYGRTREIETLIASFDRVVACGTSELVLVSGYSGIGKSAVVHELHKMLVPPRGLFASGKFDQYKRDIPYATLAQAFQSLIRPLLSKSDAELQGWRDSLQEALGPNARLIVDLVPELKLIIGDPPPVPELPPQDAQGRFQLVCRRFIGVFARPEHPLALFLDDLQWLDAATLDVLGDLLTRPEMRHLLVVGAFRDNEVTSSHPLMHKLDAIRQTGALVQEIALAPLARENLGRLIADSLHCDPADIIPLAQLVHEKTAGNPFFAIQFISALAEEGLVTFDRSNARWLWDLNRIHAKGYTDNVVDLMVGKLNRLPIATRKGLQQLACLGTSAEIPTLAVVQGISEGEVHRDLWEAVRLEFIVRSKGSYRFAHDRIQEAAYSLIPDELRAGAHLRIGRLLIAHTPPEKREEAIFEIVNQVNRGAVLITSRDEREQLAELNLIAGKHAKSSTAYASALNYFTIGGALLSDDRWERNYALTFALTLLQAECEYLSGDTSAAKERLETLSHRAANLSDSAAVACLLIELCTNLDRADRAIEIALDFLRLAGIPWSPRPSDADVAQEFDRIWQQLGTRSIEQLTDLPRMADPVCSAILDVLTALHAPANFTDGNLLALVIARMVNLSIEHGNGDGSPLGYVYLGMILESRLGDYDAGFRFGKLGVDLVEQAGLNRFKAHAYLNFGNAINPWTRHVRTSLDLLRSALSAAMQAGHLTFAAYSYAQLISAHLATGDRLDEVQRFGEAGLDFVQQTGFGTGVDLILGHLGLIRALRGLTPELSLFNHADFDETQFERHLAADDGLAMSACWYWTRKLQAYVLADELDSAISAASRAESLLWTSPGFLVVADFHFYAALARASYYGVSPGDDRSILLGKLKAHQRQIRAWAENCVENFQNRYLLVSAEIARIENRDLEAMHLYDRAIGLAREHGFVQNEGLAHEFAACFYAARGFQKIAQAYLQDARYCYLRWGAKGKVRQLDQLHPHLRKDEPVPGRTSTIGAPLENLDLATVIKVSHAISSEIVLEKLVDTLMRTAIEHAGAERGLLILPRSGEHHIQAEVTTRGDTVDVRLRDAPLVADALPESIVHYVVRTQESVILDDASVQNPFSEDIYILQHHPRSILCLPLISQTKVIGVLYLENSLTSHVFTPTRISVLKLLASQAAISLENSRLYRDLKERETKIRRLVDANIIGICIWNLEGQLIEANDAFLRMLGFSREDLVSGGLRWTDLTPSEWRDWDQRAVAELKSAGTFQPVEKEYFRKDGSRVPVLIGGALFESGGNEGVAFVLDSSELKRTEEALRRSQAYLAEAQKLTHIGSWAGNILTREIHHSSEEHSRIYGFGPNREPSFEDLYQRLHPDDRARVVQAFESASRAGKDVDVSYRVVLPGGLTRYVQAVGHPVFRPSGNLGEFAGFLMDVTERRQADEERETLRQAQADLAHVARVTTMGELTASLAHEIKQPISATVTNASAALRWLRARPPDLEEVRQALGRIVKDGNRAGDVVGRIRAFIEKAPPRKDGLKINEAILEVIALTRGEVVKNGVSVQTQLAKDLPLIQGDRVQLQQVVLNLIINAIEAMSGVGEQARDLMVCTDRSEANGVVVAVRDSGPGLASASPERLFEAFYTTKPDGLGMGLSICRSIIEAHGGRLWATANVPQGAIFQFTLPAHPDSTP